MALRPQPSKPIPYTTSRYQDSTLSTTQKTAFSTSSDSDDLEILGIKTWKGKAVFTKPVTKRDVPPARPAPSVNDLANQLIDLTVSPAPSKPVQDLTRPRGIPRFTSPSARTAFSPTKKTTNRQESNKPIHPFFKPRTSDRDSSRPGSHNSAKATTTFTPQPSKQQSTGSNPFLSPPGSPTLSIASGESTPVRPPPASQRPRLAPPSSASSSGSPSSASSSFGSTTSRSRSPSPSKPVREPVKLQKTSGPSKTSPLRVISPTVQPKKSTVQKSFKPTFNPTQKPAPTDAPKQGDPKNPSSNSPWKWTKWGWTQERPKSPTPAPTFQAKPVKAPAKKKASILTVDPLVGSMQNLGLDKAAVGDGPKPSKEDQPPAPPSTVSTPVDPAPPAPPPDPAAPLPVFSHKTYHIGNPIFTKPPTLAYITDPNEANELLSMIQGEAIAFDMEWPFTRGRFPTVGKTALIQVGDEKLVVLIHLSMMKTFPIKLRDMLEDPKIFKLGVNVIGDAQKLVRENAIYTQGILDLSDIARTVDAENCRPGSAKIALAKLCAQYIGFELDKGAVRTSNWSKKLSQEQMNYAADDVYSTTMIYNSLMHIGKQRGITVDHAALSINLSPEICGPPTTVLKDATGVKSNAAKTAKGVAPSKMRAFGYFNEGKSVLEIGKAMRSDAKPLMPNTVRGYLLDVMTSDAPLEYDKQRMYDLLSEDVHPVNYQRNKTFLAKLLKQLGKQIPRSPPAAKLKNLVSSDVELSQETNKAVL